MNAPTPAPPGAPPTAFLPFERWAFRRGLALAGVALSYFVLARLGYALTIRPAEVALWPPAGLVLALLLLTPRRQWPELLLAAMLGNLAADLSVAANPLTALGGAVANAAEPLLGAWIVQRWSGRGFTLGSMRELAALVIGAAVVGNAVSAVPGAFVVAGGVPADFWRSWFVWFAGDGLGILVVAPVLVTWAVQRDYLRLTLRRWIEFGSLCLIVVALSVFVLLPTGEVGAILGSIRYLVFPLLFLAALRFGPWGSSTATLLVAGIVAWKGAHPHPGLLGVEVGGLKQVTEIYGFLTVAALSGLVPAVEVRRRQAAELRLRSSEARFRQMAEYIEDAFFIVDLTTRHPLYVSPTWRTIWGRPLSEAYDPGIWFDAIHAEDRALVERSQKRVAAGESDSIRVRVVRPDATIRWIRSRTFPVRDADGRVYRLVGVATDITEIRNAEERLVLSQKMEALGRLAGGVAHDFNNMLTVVLGEADLLKEELTLDGQREAVQSIRDAAPRAADLTQQLLAFSRNQVVPSTVFDLVELTRGLMEMLRRLIGEHIELVEQPAPHACRVRADRGQIEQVLANLALNARDAMPNGGKLILATSVVRLDEAFVQGHEEVHLGSYVLLSVTDTGSGMSEAVRAHVFEPFFTTKAHGKGTGLGLATSYGIVKKAGGHLTVYSEPGIGSTFRLYLPLAEGPDQNGSESIPAEIPAGRGETILLVEDEVAVRRVAVRLLTMFGYQVLEAANGKEALGLLAANLQQIDLLLTDVMLPEIGGRELSERVRVLRPGTKVLYMSGYTEDSVLSMHLVESGDRLLGKPFTRQELANEVRAALD